MQALKYECNFESDMFLEKGTFSHSHYCFLVKIKNFHEYERSVSDYVCSACPVPCMVILSCVLYGYIVHLCSCSKVGPLSSKEDVCENRNLCHLFFKSMENNKIKSSQEELAVHQHL